MKRILLIAFIALFLVGCSSPQPVQSTKDDSWCVKGTTYGQQGISSTIDGIAVFKGSEFCKASAVLQGEKDDLEYTFYFNKDQSDVWIITNIAGSTQEVHKTN